MGLCIGKAALLGEVYPFTKLSKGAVLKITTAYHNISDGFGISLSEMSDILSEINDYLQMSKESVRFLVSGLFRVLDSDNNGLIDGLEALSVLAVISGMFREDIVAYILSLYDFANLSGLTYDEIILTLKSCVNGLLKIQLLDPNSKCVLSIPQDRIYDEIASNLFSSISTNESLSKNDRVDIRTISLYFSAIPEITAWLEFFNNLDSNNHLGNYRNLEKLSALRLLSGSEPSELALRIDPPVLIRSASLVDQTLQWKSQVTLLSPFNYANSSISHDTPSDEISKTWIYGLESRRGLAKVDYTKLDELVYFTGRYVLIYSHQKNTQKVFTCHRKYIAQVQLHRDSNTIVSAEIGDDPMIFVWSCESLVVQQSFQAIGSTTVSALSFSTEGTRILFIDENFVKNITLWDWKRNEIIFRGLIDASIVFSCCLLAPDRFAIAADDQVKFWNKYHEGFTNKQAVWINNRQPEIVSAMTRTLTGDNLVCGSVTGALLLFHGHSCVRYISAHSGTITSIIQSRDGYITGSKDARIRMWTVALEPRFLFDISKFSSVPIILSLSLSLDASMIVFLTLNSEIFEISALDGSDLRGGPVVQGHRQGEIYDLDTHPGKLEAVTVGSDKTLRVYDLHLCTQIKLANLGFEPTAVAYSPLGDTIAVGSNCSQGNDYKFVILSEESLSILHAAKDSEAIVACVKYSVDGEILAVGCTDGDIFLYSVPDDFDLICKCSRHRKAVFALDFSLEGEWLRSNSIDGEIYFFSVDDGSLQSNLASMRDVNWATQDCIYSWHTKGIHGSIGSSDAIVACSSSNLENPSIVAVGSALGSFRVFRYPCVHDNADFINFQIHTSKIVKIRFTFDNSYILSCGSRDRCLIQFQCRISTRIDIESTPTALPFVLDDLKALKCRDPVFPICSINDFALNQVRSRELSEGFLDLQDVPNVSLSVERVYGYEGISCLSNIFYTSPNDLLYTCSRFALLVNKQTSNQKVFQGHLNVITAIALSHDKQFIATGDLQSVLIWNSVNFEIIFTPQDTRNLPTAALSFSSDRFLMVILIDDLYCMQIYDWKCKILLSKTNLGSAPIYFCTFSDELSSASESKSAITIGKNYFRFWKSVDSNFINGFQPNLQDLNSSSTFLSAVILRNRAVAGSDDGYLALFQDFCLQQKVKSHAGAVTSILFNQNSNLYYSAGQDGFVRIWSDSFECMKEFNLEGFTKHTITACKAVAVSFDSSSIAVGTFGAEIFEIDVRRNQPIHDTLCYKGHSGQLNGLAIHPTQATFATTSDDAMLRIWNAKAYSHLRCLKLDLSSRALAFSPDGSLLAVGFGNGRKIKGKAHAKEGSILILSFETLKVMQEKKDSSHAISHLKFSPDGKLLLAGSDDCCIYVYAVDDGYALKTIIRNHEAPITGFDVSDDSAALISIDEADRLVFTTLPLGLPIHDSEQILHNLADFCIPKLWYAEGLSILQIAKQVLTWTSKSRHNPLLASGNNIGQIFVSSFPSKRLCGALMMEGHSSFVSRLGWLADGERLVSIGKSDCSVIQWKLAACGELASPSIGALHHQTLKQPEKTIFLEDESAFWKAMITGSSHIPPKLPLKSKGKNIDFNLQFVEGIGGMALNRTVNYNADGDIVYFSANFAVVFSKHHNEQKFYRQHSFAITCCQLNEKRAFAATGDEDGSIHVWDCRVVTCLLKLEKIVIGPVKDIAFSKDDKTLVVLSSDNFQALLLVQSPSGMWNDGKYSASVNVGSTWPVSWVTFFDQTEYPIVTGGGGPLSYFKVHNGSLLKKLSRYDAQLEASHDITCAINLELLGNLSLPTNTLVCGSSKGFLYVTSDSMSYSRIAAHDDAITSIAKILSSLHGGKFATAGRDQKIKLWSSTLEVVKTIDLSKVGRSLGIHFISPLCLSFHSTLSIFLVHFSNGYLIEISPDLSSYLCITQGHYSGKLSAVSFNPSNTEEYASAGEDGTIRIWNWKGRFCSSMQSVPFSSQVIKYTSDGRYIVGGSGESNPSLKNPRVGVLYVLDVPSLSISREEKKSKHSITDIALSQDDSKIAISTFEGMAVICDFQTLQTLAVVNFKYSRPAISLDFSSDETKLKIAFAPDRLAYFDLQASAPIHEPSALIDVKWRSPTWIYSWETQGVFNEEYGDVTALLVKPPHIIVAYQNGDLRLFSFPSIEPQKTSTLIIKLSSFASSIIARDKDKLLVVDSIGRTLLHFQIVEHD